MSSHQTNKLIILDFPSSYRFGIDLKCWQVGPNFRGIKAIPDGVHYVYYSVHDDFCNTGFFVHLNDGEIVVKRWDKVQEDLVDYKPSATDVERYNSCQEEITQYLGHYDMENHKNWWGVTNFIGVELIQRLMPECGRIFSVEQFVSTKSTTTDRKAAALKPNDIMRDKDGLVQLAIEPGTELRFQEIPRCLFPTGESEKPGVKSAHMLDRSFCLETVLARCVHEDDLLGELQFAFVCYTLSFKLSGLEHWLSLVTLLSHCNDALQSHTNLYSRFVTLLHRQLQLTEEDFADITTDNNKFFRSMKRLFETVEDRDVATTNKELYARVLGLKQTLQVKYEWDFEDDLDEDLPVIVELQ